MNKKSYKIIGAMSGTSIDGLDLVYVNFEKKEKWNYKILHSVTYEYSKEWSDKLKLSVSSSINELNKLDATTEKTYKTAPVPETDLPLTQKEIQNLKAILKLQYCNQVVMV